MSLQTVFVEWKRARDWLIGAAGMVLVLGTSVLILWWVLTEPGGGGAARPAPTAEAERAPGTQPPGDLPEDAVWLDDLVLDARTVLAEGSTLRDVRAVGQDVVTGADGLIASRLSVDATVPFEVVADELGGGAVVSGADDGQAVVVRTVEALGRELQVTATGTVEVEAGTLVVEPRSIDIGGPQFLSEGTAALVRTFLTIEHSIEGLPEGLVLQDVTVQDDGFRASLKGENVRLVP